MGRLPGGGLELGFGSRRGLKAMKTNQNEPKGVWCKRTYVALIVHSAAAYMHYFLSVGSLARDFTGCRATRPSTIAFCCRAKLQFFCVESFPTNSKSEQERSRHLPEIKPVLGRAKGSAWAWSQEPGQKSGNNPTQF